MNELLKNVGLISIIMVLLYIIKKIYDYSYFKNLGLYEDDDIDKAAEEFAQRAAPTDDARIILPNGIDIKDKGYK
ncbi:hypothetical protein [Paenibacillus monticola]|uniref:Uncharacterized protein n=1 Tax=Paenibacillus monticola TaxID=2666075 RepID=A0A7X2L371_9BACL|nr:hypothetical protein [Paenibacillus monticola]MRN55000.1 hypothetical protein [Paenibacillus monticola]